MTHIIQTLPTDIILEIVKRLDSYALLSFLEVFPALKELAIVITDHSDSPLFFRIPGVERAMLPVDGTVNTSTKSIHRYPIRLFDIQSNEPEVMASLLKLENAQDELKEKQDVYLNATSFLFLHTNYTCTPHHLEALTNRLDEFSDCHWHVGLPTNFNDRNTMTFRNKSMVNLATIPVFKTLTSLRLENVAVFGDCCLKSLRSLALIYTDSSIAQRPLVRGLKAKRLSRFVVHYTSMMPLFVDMDGVATSPLKSPGKVDVYDPWDLDWLLSRADRNSYKVLPKDFRGGSEHRIEVFELARIGRLEYRVHEGQRVIEDTLDKETLERMDTDFITRFAGVHLYGAPVEFIKKVDFGFVKRLRLQIGRESSASLESGLHVKPANQLMALTLVLQQDDCVYPGFLYPAKIASYDFATVSLWISIMGVRPKIKRLFGMKWAAAPSSGGFSRSLANLSIYSSPRLLKSVDGGVGDPPEPLEITHADWALLINKLSVPDHGHFNELTLIGFKMPFLTLDSHLESGRRAWNTIRGSTKAIIRPAFMLDPREHHHVLLVSGMVFYAVDANGRQIPGLDVNYMYPEESTMIVISPIFVNVRPAETLYPESFILCITTIPTFYWKSIRPFADWDKERSLKMVISKRFNGFRWYAHDLIRTDATAQRMGHNRVALTLSPSRVDDIGKLFLPGEAPNEWLFGYHEEYHT